jgi:hypothetical protein
MGKRKQAEKWKDVVGLEGKYKISNLGNIKSLSRKVNWINGNKRTIKGVDKMSFYINPQGYKSVNICGKTRLVHRIVAQAFIPNPDNKPQVNHLDFNKLNPNANNLEWVTHIENSHYGVKHKMNLFGSKIGVSKLNDSEVVAIRALFNTFNHKFTALIFRVSRRTIGNILDGKTWKHLL